MNRLAILLILASPNLVLAQTYWQDIRPVLRKHCTVCHSAKNLKEPDISGGLALDSPEAIKKGLDGAPIVRPGEADASLMMKVIVTANAKRRMPLDAPALPKETIDLLRSWIDRGAKDGVQPKDDNEPVPIKSTNVVRKRDLVFPFTVAVPGKAGKFDLALKVGPLAPIAALAFSPDGKWLAAGSYGQVAVWNLVEGKLARVLTNVLGAVNDLKFSPDNKLLAVAGGQPSAKGDLRFYDTSDWKLTGVLRGHDDVVFSVAFRADGKQLASASFDHTVALWDVTGLKRLKTFTQHSDFVYAVALDPAGQFLFSGSKDRTVQMIDTATGKTKFTFSAGEQDILAVALHPDGKTVVSGGFEPTLFWSLATGEKGKASPVHPGGTHELVFNKKGDWLASCGADGKMRINDGQTGSALKAFQVGSSVYACAFRPDSKILASGSADGVTRLWDTETGNLRLALITMPDSQDQPHWFAATPQGYVAGDDAWLKLGRWRIAGKEVAGLESLFAQPVQVARAMKGESVSDPVPNKK